MYSSSNICQLPQFTTITFNPILTSLSTKLKFFLKIKCCIYCSICILSNHIMPKTVLSLLLYVCIYACGGQRLTSSIAFPLFMEAGSLAKLRATLG